MPDNILMRKSVTTHIIASISTRNDLHKKGSHHHRPHHILKNNDTYTVVNKTGSLPQPQHHQQQQQYYSGLAGGLRKAGSYRDVDQIERETVSAMRVSEKNNVSAPLI